MSKDDDNSILVREGEYGMVIGQVTPESTETERHNNELADALAWVEFGFRACERGWNLQKTLAEAVKPEDR